MNKVHHDELEGKVIELSLQWDEHAKEDIEYDAPFFRIVPNIHAAGAPIFLTIEDACAHAALDDSGCRDCGSCRHYRLQPRGIARHLRPPVPERPASTRCAPAPPAARAWEGRQPLIRGEGQRRHTMT